MTRLLVLTLAALLTACGGGSDAGETIAPNVETCNPDSHDGCKQTYAGYKYAYWDEHAGVYVFSMVPQVGNFEIVWSN